MVSLSGVSRCESPFAAMFLQCLPPVLNCKSLRQSFCPDCLGGGGGQRERERVRERETERELSATLANHLIGCHTELTFEGYRSISPEMKKRDERRRERNRGREIGYAASVLWSRQPLSMHLSIHPHHTASSPL